MYYKLKYYVLFLAVYINIYNFEMGNTGYAIIDFPVPHTR